LLQALPFIDRVYFDTECLWQCLFGHRVHTCCFASSF
jgi:hypothetical protein